MSQPGVSAKWALDLIAALVELPHLVNGEAEYHKQE